jgi:LacI family transcriptional regulator
LPTINDVARLAGVSTVTVSRVINGAGSVKLETRTRVQQAIEELHYLPNVAARSLRSKRTNTLALLVPDITNSFWTTVARGVEDEAQNGGYSVLLCNTDEDAAKQQRYQDVIISQRVDGVILTPYDSDPQNLSRLRDRKIPIVAIDRRIEGWEVDSVTGDSVTGARALVNHLIGLGHQRIAIISGPINTSTSQDRVTGYRMALGQGGIPADPDLIKFGEFRSLSGEELTYQLLDLVQRPTAIFAANNTIAMGVIKAVDRRGLHIPQDIALVCFDDIPNLSLVFPFLTVVVQPAYEIGVRAAQLLLSRLEGTGTSSMPPRRIVLPTRLIIRHSCGSKLSNLSLPMPEFTTEPGNPDS